MSNWRYFKLAEFACKHCGENKMDPAFITRLDELRDRVGFPLVVTSGYRCPVHNQAVSSTGPAGPHTTGKAVDLAVDRGRAYDVLREAMEMRFRGVGVQQKGAGRFLHLDDMPESGRPTIWSY